MTLQTTNNTTQSTQTLIGNLVFIFDYRMDLSTDAVVTVDSVAVSGFAITGLGDDPGGSVTLVTAPAIGAIVVVSRQVPETQNVSYPVRGAFPAPSHEGAMDRQVMMIQQIDERTKRSIRFPLGDVADPTLASPAARANKFMNFDAQGNVIYSTGTGNDPDLRADLADPLLGDALLLGQKTLTGSSSFTYSGFSENRGVNLVTDFGADKTGVTDISSALISAINALPDGGGIFIPAGTYLCSSVVPLSGLIDIQIVGEGWQTIINHRVAGGVFLDIGDASADRTADIKIMDMRVTGDGTTSHGIRMTRTHRTIMSGLRVELCGGDGINAQGCFASSIIDNRCSNNVGSGIVSAALAAAGTDFVQILRNKCLSNGSNGIHIDNTLRASAGCHVNFNDIEGNLTGLRMDVGSTGNSEVASSIGNYFESQTGMNLEIGTDGGTGFFRSFMMANNIINPGTVSSIVNACAFDRIQGATIGPNVFANCDVTITAQTVINIWTGNTDSGSTFPAGYANALPSFENLNIHEAFGGAGATTITRAGNQLRINSQLGSASSIHGGAATTGSGFQTDSGLFSGIGAPDNAVGKDNDFYFRGDGGALTTIYRKAAGVWTGIV